MPTPPVPPKILTGRELYDALMAHIEPELTSDGYKALATTYANESAEDKAARMKRYELAFERCEQSYQEYMQTLDAQVNRYRQQAFAHAELEDREQENGLLDHFSTLFQSTTT